jgi:hypothetical protein
MIKAMNRTQALALAERIREQLRAREVIREVDGFLILERAVHDRACDDDVPIIELCVEEDDDTSFALNMYRGTRKQCVSGASRISSERYPYAVTQENISAAVIRASLHLRTNRRIRRPGF